MNIYTTQSIRLNNHYYRALNYQASISLTSSLKNVDIYDIRNATYISVSDIVADDTLFTNIISKNTIRSLRRINSEDFFDSYNNSISKNFTNCNVSKVGYTMFLKSLSNISKTIIVADIIIEKENIELIKALLSKQQGIPLDLLRFVINSDIITEKNKDSEYPSFCAAFKKYYLNSLKENDAVIYYYNTDEIKYIYRKPYNVKLSEEYTGIFHDFKKEGIKHYIDIYNNLKKSYSI